LQVKTRNRSNSVKIGQTRKIGSILPSLTDFEFKSDLTRYIYIYIYIYMLTHKIIRFYESTRDFDKYATKYPYTTKERDESALTVSLCGFMVRVGLFFTKKEQGTDRKETINVPRTRHSLIWKNLHKKLQEKKEKDEEMGFELVAGINDVV